MKYDLLLKNGTTLIPIKNSDQDFGLKKKLKQEKLDIGVSNGKIVELGSLSAQNAEKVIDVDNLHVLPGMIDSQVHFREPGLIHKEDLESGTRAALLGGVSCVFEMPNTLPATTTKELFEDKLLRAKKRCHTHYAFFIGACEENIEQLSELERLRHCSGVKIFMGSSTGTLLVSDDQNLLKILKNTRRRVIVHCEDEFRLKERKQHFSDQKNFQVSQHHLWRDEISSVLATKRLITLCERLNRKAHVLHVTTSEEIEFLKHKKKYASVEVLPQHLTLFAPECYEKLGTLAQQNPPIREKHHLEALWKGISEGVIDIIGSDHAPHTLEEKSKNYPQTPGGMPGVQTLIPVMLNHVNQGKLSLERFVEMMTENVRDVFGLKNTGRIEIGADANFSIVDLNHERVITNEWIVSRSKWTPFDGMKVKGWPRIVILDGELCMQDNEVISEGKGKGVFFE